jgi:hypothetical protein
VTKPRKPLAERAAEGEYSLVLPLDFKIVGELPDDGTMLAGLYEIGMSFKELKRTFPPVAPSVLSGRLRVLLAQGIVKKVTLVGGQSTGVAWQRTKLGKELYEEWRKNNG